MREAAPVSQDDIEYAASSSSLDDAASVDPGVNGGVLANPKRN